MIDVADFDVILSQHQELTGVSQAARARSPIKEYDSLSVPVCTLLQGHIMLINEAPTFAFNITCDYYVAGMTPSLSGLFHHLTTVTGVCSAINSSLASPQLILDSHTCTFCHHHYILI